MEATFYNFMVDREEYNRFVSIFTNLSGVKEIDMFMYILAARRKYLSEAERKEYSLGDSSVLLRTLVRDNSKEYHNRVVSRMNCMVGSYVDKNNVNLPEHCFVTYFTINPRNMFNGTFGFIDQVNDYTRELANSSKRETALEKFRFVDRNLDSRIQSCRGTDFFIDFDCDIPGDKSLGLEILHEKFLSILRDVGVEYHLIETRSGYHMMVNKKMLSENKQLNRDIFLKILPEIDEIGELTFGEKFEFVVNKNDMVPVPGTRQGGFSVKLLS